MATAALDRTIVLWEISTRTSLSVLVLSEVSAHSIVYSYDFEYLVSAGYEMAAIV